MFAIVLLMVGGWGIAAIGRSHFFAANQHYMFGSLRGWGWIMLILGVLQLIAASSLFTGASSAGTSAHVRAAALTD